MHQATYFRSVPSRSNSRSRGFASHVFALFAMIRHSAAMKGIRAAIAASLVLGLLALFTIDGHLSSSIVQPDGSATVALVSHNTDRLMRQPIEVPTEYNLMHRLQIYCNNPTWPLEGEGNAPVEGAQLRQVHIFFRHGDRSAIHSLPNTSKDLADRWKCTAPSHHEVQWAAGVLAPLVSSSDCILHGDCAEREHTDRTTEAFAVWSQAKEEGSGCGVEPGQLSSIGWQQLQTIGSQVASIYEPLLMRDDDNTVALQIVSTDTGRTMLSATAFLRGFLHGIGLDDPHPDGSLCEEDEGTSDGDSSTDRYHAPQGERSGGARCADLFSRGKATLVPQLVLPQTLHVVPRPEDPLMASNLVHTCPRAKEWEKERRADIFKYAKLPEALAQEMASMIGLSDPTKLPDIEETVDALYAGLCHSYPLPCWSDEPSDFAKVELEDEQYAGMSSPEDRRIHALSKALYAHEKSNNKHCLTPEHAKQLTEAADKHYSNRFQRQSIRWMSFPIFQQVFEQMRRIRDQAPTAPRIVMRAAHDTVLSPILSVLGLAKRAYAWPGYASRIMMELWEGPEASDTPPVWYVRVVYNGVDITEYTECARVSGADGACTLDAFEAIAANLLDGEKDWHSFCKAKAPKSAGKSAKD